MANLVYPSSLVNNSLNPGFIQLSYFKNSDNASDPTVVPLDKIALKMPDKISQPSTVNWGTEDFGVASSAVKALLQKASGTGNENSGANMSGSEILAGGAARMAQQGAFQGLAALTKTVGGNASAFGLMGEVLGKAPNPYVTAIFKGVDFRNFNFTFIFTPLSEADCTLIDNIIKTMRANALPDYVDNQAFLSYPSYCEIKYVWRGELHPYLNRFKRAACTSINVDYTGTGAYQTMRNGFPTQIIVDTGWKELDIVTRNDVLLGGF